MFFSWTDGEPEIITVLNPPEQKSNERDDSIRQLRPLLLTDSDVFAGTERHMLDLAAALKQIGVPTIIGCPEQSALLDKAKLAGIPTITASKQRFLFDMTNKLLSALSSKRVNVIHVHNGVSHLSAAAAIQLSSSGCCISTQHFVAPARLERRGLKGFVSKSLHSWAASKTSQFIAVSRSVADVCVSTAICSPSKISVVANGTTPIERTSLAPEAVRAKFDVPNGAELIVSVSRLMPEKGVDVLIKAMKEVVRQIPNAHCLVSGEGAMRGVLQELVEQQGMNRNVQLVGHQEDPASIVNASDLFVLPGSNEGFGLALLEAMMLGKPVIAADAGGPSEIIADDVDGFLFAPDVVSSLADRIIKALSSKKLAKKLGEGR